MKKKNKGKSQTVSCLQSVQSKNVLLDTVYELKDEKLANDIEISWINSKKVFFHRWCRSILLKRKERLSRVSESYMFMHFYISSNMYIVGTKRSLQKCTA